MSKIWKRLKQPMFIFFTLMWLVLLWLCWASLHREGFQWPFMVGAIFAGLTLLLHTLYLFRSNLFGTVIAIWYLIATLVGTVVTGFVGGGVWGCVCWFGNGVFMTVCALDFEID